jgi:hypothetical protein
MNVSVVMKSLKPYSPALWLAELQTLLETSCRNRTIPCEREPPLPHNTDVVRNTHCNDINTQKIELTAAAAGIERTAWIFGADAEFLGLRLREPDANDPFDPDPLLWFAHITSRPETPLEAQTVYLIDQFTGESLDRLASYAYEGFLENREAGEEEKTGERRRLMAQHVLFALHDYDSGLSDTGLHRLRQEAVKDNTTPGTAGFPVAQTYYAAASGDLNKTHKQLFNTMLNYRSVQNTGTRNIDWNNGRRPEPLYESIRELTATIRKTAQVLFNAQMVAHVLASPLRETPPRLPSAAMRLFTREKAGPAEQKRREIQA